MRTTVLPLLLLASCSVQRDFSEAFLWPSSVEVAVPTDVALAYEDVTLETGSETTVHGWFIPSAEADGRTVLFSHGNGINITFCHPYYTFLHEAGFNVFVYDYRGFGKSWGGVSMDALLSDMADAMDYLRSRPDVDPDKIALYGVSIGSLPTLRGASRFAGITGIVVEDVVSPQEFEVQQQDEGGASIGSGIGVYFASYLAIPWALNPETSAAAVDLPMLYLTGAKKADLDLQLRIYSAARGPKTIWVMPDVGNVPTSLLVHDREYQRAVSSFLATCFQGERPERVAIDYRARQRGPEWVTQFTLERRGTDVTSPWPVEIGFLQRGRITFHRVWLEEQEQRFEVTLPSRPMRAVAWRYGFAEGDPSEGSWRPGRTPLAEAYQIHGGLIPYVELMQQPDASIETALQAGQAIESAERNEAFSPALEAELTELFWFVGRELLGSKDPAEREQGRIWLERCVASVPDDPKMHYWPDSEELFGFAYGEVVARASLTLADLYGREGRGGDAVRVLEAAVRVAPEDPAVQQKLAEIRQPPF